MPALTQPLTQWSDVFTVPLAHPCLWQGDHSHSQTCSCLWGHDSTHFVHPFVDEGRSCVLWLVLFFGGRTEPGVWVQLGERPHSSWHWREWQQLMWDRMWPWQLVWPHPPAAAMWQCIPICCAFILLLSRHWSWTSMPSKYLPFSRTSPDQGCASSSWGGIRDQGLFYSCRDRSVWPRTCLPGKENYIAAPCICS